MGKTARGLPTELHPMRVDAEVWAAIQAATRAGKTVNEVLRAALFAGNSPPPLVFESQIIGHVEPEAPVPAAAESQPVVAPRIIRTPEEATKAVPVVVPQKPEGRRETYGELVKRKEAASKAQQ